MDGINRRVPPRIWLCELESRYHSWQVPYADRAFQNRGSHGLQQFH